MNLRGARLATFAVTLLVADGLGAWAVLHGVPGLAVQRSRRASRRARTRTSGSPSSTPGSIASHPPVRPEHHHRVQRVDRGHPTGGHRGGTGRQSLVRRDHRQPGRTDHAPRARTPSPSSRSRPPTATRRTSSRVPTAICGSPRAIGKIGRITPGSPNTITEFPIPSGQGARGITVGPDGNIWFAETFVGGQRGRRQDRADHAGQPEHHHGVHDPDGDTDPPAGSPPGPTGTCGSPRSPATASDASRRARRIPSRSSPSRTANSRPFAIVTGPDGNLWFTEAGTGEGIGRISPNSPNTITEFSIPGGEITNGPDGNLWFTQLQPVGLAPGHRRLRQVRRGEAEGDRQEGERQARVPGEGREDRRLLGPERLRRQGRVEVHDRLREGGRVRELGGGLREPRRLVRVAGRRQSPRRAEQVRGVEAHGGVQGRRRTLQLRRQVGIAREAGRSGLRDPATGHEDTGQADGGLREGGPLGPVLRRSDPARPGHRAGVPRPIPVADSAGTVAGFDLLLKQRGAVAKTRVWRASRRISLTPRSAGFTIIIP